MVKYFTILILSVFLIGCTTAPVCIPKTEYVEVKIPVVVYPDVIPDYKYPELELSNLTDTSTDEEVAKAYKLTIIQLKTEVQNLVKILNSLKIDSKNSPN